VPGCCSNQRAWIRRQVELDGVGRVDFLVNGWFIVEVNGYQFHSSRDDWRKDMARLNAAELFGYGTLSYAPEQVWNNSDHVLTEIHAMLQRDRPPGQAHEHILLDHSRPWQQRAA
jgi:very-short-patch-repair endonuclease